MFTQKTIRGWEEFVTNMDMSYGFPFELVKNRKSRRLGFIIRATQSKVRLILWIISLVHLATNGLCATLSFVQGIYFQDRKTFSLAIDFANALTYFYIWLFQATLLWKRDEIAALLNETIRFDGVLVKIFGCIIHQPTLKSDGVDVLLKACIPSTFVFPCATVGLFLLSPHNSRYLLHYLPNVFNKGLRLLAVLTFALVEYRIHTIVTMTIYFHMILLVTYGRMSNRWVHFIT